MRKSLLVACLITFLFMMHGLSHASNPAQEYSKANKLFMGGKYSDAVVLYQSILPSPPNNVSPSLLYTRIGDSYFRLGDYQSALDAYRRALKDQKGSERPPTQYWIGFCCLMLGRDPEAVDEFLKIPEVYPHAGMWVGTAYYWAGRASERMGRKAQAAQYYRKAGGKGKSTQERFALKKAEKVNKGARVQ